MLRRCARDLYSLRPLTRIPRPISSQGQTPMFLSSRSKSSQSSQQGSTQKTPPSPQEEPSQSRGNASKLLLGTLVVGAAAMAAYQAGYINLQFKDRKLPYGVTEQNTVKVPEDLKTPTEQNADQKQVIVDPNTEVVQDSSKLHPPKDLPTEGTDVPEMTTAGEQSVPVQEKETEDLAQDTLPVPVEPVDAKPLSQDAQATEKKAAVVDDKATSESSDEQTSEIGSTVVPAQSGSTAVGPHHDALMHTDTPKDPLGTGAVEQKSLAETYLLQEEPDVSKEVTYSHTIEKPDRSNIDGRLSSDKESNDGKVVLDIIEAIHAAERKQAESDAYLFSEEKRKLKEKYEKELKDTRARELMYAEEAAILEKELKKEKVKSAAAIKELQEKAGQNLREELQRKDEETSRQLEKVQELSKAELVAALAKEKASQIEQIAEANLNIDALCMAFYARSEEARQSHSVHRLALGTLALEQALSNGSPIRTEVDALRKSLEGIDKDSLLELALSSLPEEVLDYGSDTQMKLKQKFNSLKGTIRHFSLIPAGGGGILTHAVARVASSIKIEEDQSGDGVESVISRVENLIADGDLRAAADSLEEGLCGSEAEEVATEWVKQARKRAIAEQTVALLHSYAASITFS